jgi:mannose-6-phosphate isomerase-like protein (cupin superfamily)
MFLPATEATSFEWYGLAISDHTAGLELSSSVVTIDVPPGARHPRAWSDRSDKYYVIMEGRVRFQVGGESSDLGPADVCIVGRGEIFEYANRTRRPARLTLVHTPPFAPDAEHLEE